ncbi:cation:proton antiporter [Thermosipho melanesiensis]|uniref:Monovalent cation/proton antiporter, MnhG/PhaG subunit n=2 Tax=Thermosipho melanesiensis TaxID=46541 RepID=A6LMB5_THEM4|nr:monovalent cation/H(+) antiporter subunit G [Thermosipho melanesiensis]ABR31066.1 monovalent cation/proton antiporter, MnhG/PhaG subunit [Thermosipho melanesiensis BI429]APT74160.1 cation:proton antiporter [Thermosipho melanesiensis]OOC36106.1 cation:proton antiporter [Thermosipho melanesiensis]OOC36923.1 cation:proton antiporter [Thermosipho melanesiensis]OOC37674.1 cation:proton antiporter [Thermosipho melanesiensis]
MMILGYLLIVIGAFFYFLGGLGIFRMPDVYNRLQAGTKATTLGSFSVILGVGLVNLEFLPKALVIIAFIALTNPVGSSVLARSAYLKGIKPTDKTQVDEYKGGEKE